MKVLYIFAHEIIETMGGYAFITLKKVKKLINCAMLMGNS